VKHGVTINMKFLVDMPLSPKTVDFLKKSGYEAIRVNELGIAGSRFGNNGICCKA